MSGHVTNTFVAPYDDPSFQGNQVWIRARVVDSQQPQCTTQLGRKVLLLLRSADWQAVVHCSGPVRILQARVTSDEQTGGAGLYQLRDPTGQVYPSCRILQWGFCGMVSCCVCIAFQPHAYQNVLDN